MKKVIYIFSLLILIGCNEKEDYNNSNSILDKVKIIQERVDGYPVKLNAGNSSIVKTKSFTFDPYTPEYALGRSVNFQNIPLFASHNINFSVIDIESYFKEHKGSFTILNIKHAYSDYFSYASYDRYEEKSSASKKKSSGFSLGFGPVKLGAKKTMTEVFSKSLSTENNVVYGELNIDYEDASYSFIPTTSDKNLIKLKYLDKDFVRNLYENPIYETMSYYGPAVLSSYTTGGKAVALYKASYSKVTTTEGVEKELEKSIEASYGGVSSESSGSSDTASGSLGIGKKYSNGKESSNLFTNVYSSVQTYGGISGHTKFSDPLTINVININLDSWLQSLSNQGNLVVSSINDGGLLPITDFVIEENFREHIQRYFKYNKSEELREPIIYHILCPFLNDELKPWACLWTRTGEIVQIFDSRYTKTEQRSDYINNQILPIFKCKHGYFEAFQGGPVGGIWAGIYNIFLDTAKKYEDPNTGFKYILISGADFPCDPNAYGGYFEVNSKIAFSIHNDYILDTYGIRDWYNNMPATNTTRENIIRNYKIIGL